MHTYLITDDEGIVIAECWPNELARTVANLLALGHNRGRIDNQDGGYAYLEDWIAAHGDEIEQARQEIEEELEEMRELEEETRDPHHWHAAGGITGYGPEVDEGAATFTDDDEGIRYLVDYIRDEMSSYADMAIERAHIFGESGMFEDAWKEYLRSEDLDTQMRTFDNNRETFPAYAAPGSWIEHIRGQILETFPMREVMHAGSFYVWECDEEECQDDA